MSEWYLTYVTIYKRVLIEMDDNATVDQAISDVWNEVQDTDADDIEIEFLNVVGKDDVEREKGMAGLVIPL